MTNIDDLILMTEEATEQVNIYLTNKIIDRIKAIMLNQDITIIPSSRRDIVKMLGTGKTLTEIEKEVEKALPSIAKEVKQAFKDAANEIEREQDGFLEEAILANGIDMTYHKPRKGVYVPTKDLYLTDTEKSLLESAYRRTNGTIKNLTATTANATQTELIDTLDRAYNKVTRGVSLHTATAEAIDEYSKVGTCVMYGNKPQKLETAITRAVRTGLEQASGDITLARCNELDVKQVLVSSHLGARYTDKDEPANHMSWQGKVYDYNQVSSKATDSVGAELQQISKALPKTREDSNGDFIKITGYGTGEGLCGWNCRHTFVPFYKGMKNNFNNYDSDENKKMYDLQQRQRAMERKIRELRRNYEALKQAYKSADEPLKSELKPKYDTAHKKYVDAVKTYNEWSKANGLRPKQERLKIANV